MNGEYIRNLESQEMSDKLQEFYIDDQEIQKFFADNSSNLEKIIFLAQTRMKTLKDFKELVLVQSVILTPEEKEFAQTLQVRFEKINDWNKDAILEAMRAVLQETKAKGSLLYKVITGKEKGLPLPESLEMLGKEKTIARLNTIS